MKRSLSCALGYSPTAGWIGQLRDSSAPCRRGWKEFLSQSGEVLYHHSTHLYQPSCAREGKDQGWTNPKAKRSQLPHPTGDFSQKDELAVQQSFTLKETMDKTALTRMLPQEIELVLAPWFFYCHQNSNLHSVIWKKEK